MGLEFLVFFSEFSVGVFVFLSIFDPIVGFELALDDFGVLDDSFIEDFDGVGQFGDGGGSGGDAAGEGLGLGGEGVEFVGALGEGGCAGSPVPSAALGSDQFSDQFEEEAFLLDPGFLDDLH